jgi:chemotaxis protein MotB
MYSISSVNEGKYKSLTHSLGTAFSNKNEQEKVLDPVKTETPFAAIQPILLDNSAVIFKPILLDNPAATFKPIAFDNPTTAEGEKRRQLSEEILNERRQLNQVSDQLEAALGAFINGKLVSVKRNDYWIALEMNSELLFLSGEATLSKKAQPVLNKIAEVINPLPNAINVEGHTDNIPIDTLKFPSNWDLSSARATSVVQEFVKEGINPTRLSAIGYGEFHPIGDNKIEEGRFMNRRVILVLMSQAFSRYGANDEERAKLLNLVPTAASDGTPVSKP